MALIQAYNPSSGGGGGGNIAGWLVVQYEQNYNFDSGDVQIILPNTPFSDQSVRVDYNGQVLQYGEDFTIATDVITILFADPYVTSYDNPPVFQVYYPYS